MIIYNKEGEAVNCDKAQLPIMLKAGYTRSKPSEDKVENSDEDNSNNGTDDDGGLLGSGAQDDTTIAPDSDNTDSVDPEDTEGADSSKIIKKKLKKKKD